MPASKARKARRRAQRLAEYSKAIGAEPYLETDTLNRVVTARDNYEQGWTAEIYALAMSRRHWTGLPNGVSERLLEKLLCLDGWAVIYKDGKVNGEKHYAAQRLGTLSAFDSQEDWPLVFGTGADGSTSRIPLTPANSVIVYDNMARIPLTTRVTQWASDLAQIDLQRSRNIAMQNAYSLLYVDQSRIEDAKRIVRNQNTGIFGEIAIADKDTAGSQPIVPGTIQTGVTPIMDKLTVALSAKLNEVYSQLGIEFIAVEKQERLINKEATAGQDIVNRHRYYYLEEAKLAARQMNRIFGTDCNVTWNSVNENGEDDGDITTEADQTLDQ